MLIITVLYCCRLPLLEIIVLVDVIAS